MPFALFVLASSAIAAATVAAPAWLARRRPPLATAAALLGATALLLFHGLAFFRFFADDAFISLRYAHHLAHGLGPNWNASGHVEGYTSFLHMASLAALAKLGLDLVPTAQTLGALAVVGTFVLVLRIWRLWASDEPQDSYLRSHHHPASFPFSALALAPPAMTRPEALLAVAVTAAFKLAHLSDPAQRRQTLRHLLAWSALFLLLYGSYFGWRWAYYGHLLPNT